MKKTLPILFTFCLTLLFASPASAHYNGRVFSVGHVGYNRTAFVGYGSGYAISQVILQAPALVTYVQPAVVVQQTAYAAPAYVAPQSAVAIDPGAVPVLPQAVLTTLWAQTPAQVFAFLSSNYGVYARQLFVQHFGTYANGRAVFNPAFRTAFQARAFARGVTVGAREVARGAGRFDLRRAAFNAGRVAGARHR